MKRVLLILVISIGFFLLTSPEVNIACAQLSATSCTITEVGDSTEPTPTLSPECSGGGSNCIKPPNYPSDLRGAIISKFGVTFNGFDQEHLKWFWEELWNTSGTKFSQLARGAIIQGTFCPGGGNFSCMVGCGNPAIYFGTYAGEEFNKVLIVHELGHYIMGCKTPSETHLPQFDAAFGAEGGITEYSRNAVACTGSGGVSNHNEDFAESITYYLHPQSQSQSIACAAGQPNPYYTNGIRNNNYPLHYQWAIQALGRFACQATP